MRDRDQQGTGRDHEAGGGRVQIDLKLIRSDRMIFDLRPLTSSPPLRNHRTVGVGEPEAEQGRLRKVELPEAELGSKK